MEFDMIVQGAWYILAVVVVYGCWRRVIASMIIDTPFYFKGCVDDEHLYKEVRYKRRRGDEVQSYRICLECGHIKGGDTKVLNSNGIKKMREIFTPGEK